MRTPATANLIAMIHEIEDGTRPLAWENLDELGAASARGLNGDHTMQITFEGRRALVTGAAHGIGRAIALALAADGRR